METCLLLGKNTSVRALICYPRIYLGDGKTQSYVREKASKELEEGVHILALLTWRREALVLNFSNYFLSKGSKSHIIWPPLALIKLLPNPQAANLSLALTVT